MKIVVVGASGRMGQEIAKIARLRGEDIAIMGVARSGIADGYARTEKSLMSYDAHEYDVIIDFSLPESFSENLKLATIAKKPIVSGVTGINETHKNDLKKVSSEIPVLWSSNMSLGIAVLQQAIKSFAAIKEFDFQIEELHHNKKRDNPSGTAITLQETLNTITTKNNPNPIGIRGGGIFGVHKVWAMSEEEVLCFEHQALSRAVFAKGALTCASWIAKRPAGLYTIHDVLDK